MKCAFIFAFICIFYPIEILSDNEDRVSVRYAWKSLQFAYNSREQLDEDFRTKAYIPENPAPIDVEVYYMNHRKHTLVTLPRFKNGIPITLGRVSEFQYEGQEVLIPYPNWQMHRLEFGCQEDRLVSVFRTKQDSCGRLWVLDSGFIGNGSGVVCPPQILAFNLTNDQIVHRFEFPNNVYDKMETVLITPVVEEMDSNCGDVFVYMADVGAGSIYVYSSAKRHVWRVQDNSMMADPNYSHYEIAGSNFNLSDAVFGMDLSPPGPNRKLFYHPLSANTQSWVYTRELQDYENYRSLLELFFPRHPTFHTFRPNGTSQAAAMAINQNGIAFFNFVTEYTMNCWNTNTTYGRETISTFYENFENVQFASGVKIVTNPWSGLEELWFITSRYQRVATNSFDFEDVNFRIIGGCTRDLLVGTKCLNQ